jgi:deoxyribodipyrimidine photo-lyase
MTRGLVWFRRDLRTRDHSALHSASAKSERGVVGVFLVTPEQWRLHGDAPVKVEFWMRGVRALALELAGLGIPLVVERAERESDVPRVLLELAARFECTEAYFNREYEVDERRRDDAVALAFAARGLGVSRFHDRVLLDPASVRSGAGRFYTRYTPFRNAVLRRLREEGVRVLTAPKPRAPISPPRAGGTPLEGFESEVDPRLWEAGEAAGLARLRSFSRAGLAEYAQLRDVPAVDGTSVLSPYLCAGMVSIRQCVGAAMRAEGEGAAKWLDELLWREFCQHILAAFPRVSMGRPFKAWARRIRWREDPAMLERWRLGRTGVPIVDAGMRQLLATGWMHNRARMITAMFLSKDLFLDWRLGEEHFMRHLVDGELAPNNAGWQWCASTGCDAAPYFRVFNPALQSRKFDPRGEYIRRWVPELAGVEGDAIHDPRGADPGLFTRLDYPEAMVSREGLRDRVSAEFARAARG